MGSCPATVEWKRRRRQTFMVSFLVTRLELPMLFRHAFKPNFPAHRVGFACHPRHVLLLGRASKSLWCHCCVHFPGILVAEPCGKYTVTNMSKAYVGFRPVGEEWQSCYFHPALKLYLVVYVDDFKIVGPKENLVKGWPLIRKGLDIEPPSTNWGVPRVYTRRGYYKIWRHHC